MLVAFSHGGGRGAGIMASEIYFPFSCAYLPQREESETDICGPPPPARRRERDMWRAFKHLDADGSGELYELIFSMFLAFFCIGNAVF